MRSVPAIILSVLAAVFALVSPAAAQDGCCSSSAPSAPAVTVPAPESHVCGSGSCCCGPAAGTGALEPVCDSCDCFSPAPDSLPPFVPTENRSVQFRTAALAPDHSVWNPALFVRPGSERLHAPAPSRAGPPVYLLKRVFRI